MESPLASGEEDVEDIRGFRQWSRDMQEDLVALRDQLLAVTQPPIDPDSKAFSRQLLGLFQERHPSCMESARSLLSKLQAPDLAELARDSPGARHRKKPGRKPGWKVQEVVELPVTPPPPPRNPALEIVSDIEGFTDWNLGMVRDFISCMDRARRKYSDMKEVDPGMKLVPLLLSEWRALYPHSEETVKTFLVRIRFLKTNKESIKQRLGQHDLLPKMAGEGEVGEPELVPVVPADRPVEKFVWSAEVGGGYWLILKEDYAMVLLLCV